MNLHAVPRILLLIALAGVLGGSSCSWSFTSGEGENDHDADDGGSGTTMTAMETATFGGAELSARLGGVPGILKAEAGWDGDGRFFGAWLAQFTGHRPATRVRFDPAQVSLAELLADVRVRTTRPAVTLLARNAGQAGEARAAWPPDTVPRLVVHRAQDFTPGD